MIQQLMRMVLCKGEVAIFLSFKYFFCDDLHIQMRITAMKSAFDNHLFSKVSHCQLPILTYIYLVKLFKLVQLVIDDITKSR